LSEAGLAIDDSRVTPQGLGSLIRLAASGAVSASAAKHLLARMMDTGGAPDALAAAEGLLQESDGAVLDALIERVLAAHEAQAEQYRAGRTAVAQYLVGQVMKASGGRANPAEVDRRVRARLARPAG
jgi:aspartyl-tRNA(Asn)/glutamyl-tRNA(Gln) amidotransferase subunit B